MSGTFPVVITLYAFVSISAEAATSVLYPGSVNIGLSPQGVRPGISSETGTPSLPFRSPGTSHEVPRAASSEDTRANHSNRSTVQEDVKLDQPYEPTRVYSEDAKNTARADPPYQIPVGASGTRIPQVKSNEGLNIGNIDSEQDANKRLSSKSSNSGTSSNLPQVNVTANRNSTSAVNNTNSSSNATDDSGSLLQSIQENVHAIKQPLVKTITTVGSSQCDKVKSLFGLSYTQLEGEKEPEIDKLQLHVRRSKSVTIYNIEDAAEEIPRDLNNQSKVVIFIHGFTDDPTKSSFQNISNSFLEKGGYNVIALDGSPLIRWLYLRSTTYVRFMGERLGGVLAALYRMGLNPKDILIVGHSLGAHIAGFTGKTFHKLVGASLGRISALDPAGPCFTSVDDDLRLRKDDAEFVDVMHTNAGVFGFSEPLGHVDFFVNGGSAQPGCNWDSCSHSRSWLYYSESVTNPDLFLARKCKDWRTFEDNKCGDTEVTAMGFGTPTDVTGEFYLQTSAESPFGKGEKGLSYEGTKRAAKKVIDTGTDVINGFKNIADKVLG